MLIDYIKSLLRNFYNNVIINYVDYFTPKKGPISESGFIIYKNLIEKEEYINQEKFLCKKIINSQKIKKEVSNLKGLGNAINFNDHLLYSDFLIEVFNSSIINHIRLYLGSGFKLDHTYLSVFNTSNGEFENRISAGLFHHDSVGHRIKMFIPINEKGTLNNPTIYLQGSNKTKWNFFENSENNFRIRINEQKIKLFKNKEKKLALNFNDILIFDTNGIHKGEYMNSKQNRLIIQFEFSNQKTHLRGQVGPGSFYLSPLLFEKLKELNLLRLNRLRYSDNKILHLGKTQRTSTKRLSDYLKV